MTVQEHMFAVAVRDGEDLFLWLRIRRASSGIYCILPTGRNERVWKKWDPHVSQHKDGCFHHKSFNQKMLPQSRQKPDSGFSGTENLMTRPIASEEPRAFNEICDPAKFSGVMEVPVGLLSSKKYETHISVDLTEPGGRAIITPNGEVLAQQRFDEAVPVILVTVFAYPALSPGEESPCLL